MKKHIQFKAVLLIFALCLVGQTSTFAIQPPEPLGSTLKVMRIGNSHTIYTTSAMPAILDGSGLDYKLQESLFGGRTLLNHATGVSATHIENLQKESWDYVFLQGHGRFPADAWEEYDSFGDLQTYLGTDTVRGAIGCVDMILGEVPDTRIVWFATPAYYGQLSRTPYTNGAYEYYNANFTPDARHKIAYVSNAYKYWYDNLAWKYDFTLHNIENDDSNGDPDIVHPNSYGAYLTALVHFESMTGVSSVGLQDDYVSRGDGFQLTPAIKAELQQVATLITGAPAVDWNGNLYFDPVSGTVKESDNNLPVITSELEVDTTGFYAGGATLARITATDADADQLYYTWNILSGGNVISSETTLTSETSLSFDSSGGYTVSVTVTDAPGQSVTSQTVDVGVFRDPADLLEPYRVCFWTLDDGAGVIANDSTVYENDGELINAPTWTSEGKYDGALTFDGTNSVRVPFAKTVDAYTVSLWVKAVEPGGTSTSFFNNNSDGNDFQLQAANGNFSYRGSTTRTIAPITYVWNHIAVSCDGTDTSLYFNGIFVATVTAADVDFGQIEIGSNRDGSWKFTGSIDDVKVFTKALSAAEILDAMEPTLYPEADAAPPAAPQGLTVGSAAAEVALSWTANTEADLKPAGAYTLYRSSIPGSGYSVIAQDLTLTSYTDELVVIGQSYYYQVTATDVLDNESAPSAELAVTVQNLPAGIGIVGNTTGLAGGEFADYTGLNDVSAWGDSSVNDGSVTLSVSQTGANSDVSDATWEDGGNFDYIGVGSEIAFNSGASSATQGDAIANLQFISVQLDSSAFDGNALTLNSISASVFRRYWTSAKNFQWAYDADGDGFDTGDFVGTAVENVNANANDGGAAAAAFTVSSGPLTTTAAGSQEVRLYFWNAGGNDGGAGMYEVQAVYTMNVPSETDTTPPAAPQGLTVDDAVSEVVLSWTANTEDDLEPTGPYTLYRSDSSGSGYSLIASNLSLNAYTDASVTIGQSYYYQVTATDFWGNESAPSTELAVTVENFPSGIGIFGNTTGLAGGDFADYSGLNDVSAWGDSSVNNGFVTLSVSQTGANSDVSDATWEDGGTFDYIGAGSEIAFNSGASGATQADAIANLQFISVQLGSSVGDVTLNSISASVFRRYWTSAKNFQWAYDADGDGFDTGDFIGTAVENVNANANDGGAAAAAFTVSSGPLTTTAAGSQEARLYFWNAGNNDGGAGLYEVQVTYAVAGADTNYYASWADQFGGSATIGLNFDDYDGDGQSNLAEYMLGGDPTNSGDSGNMPHSTVVEDGATDYMEYIYYKRDDAAARGLVYSLEVSDDLSPLSWTNAGYEVVGEGPSVNGFKAVTNRMPIQGDSKFIRLRVEEVQ